MWNALGAPATGLSIDSANLDQISMIAILLGVVAVLLVLGSLPCFVGLAVVMPVLGHATWHLYRRLVA